MTIDKIVERLLEEKHISAEEAIILLKGGTTLNGFMDIGSAPVRTDGKVPYHTICGCDVCHCVMGNKMVDIDSSGNYVLKTNITTS